MALTPSSVVSMTEARLFTLARGIRAIILSSRFCSLVSCSRCAIPVSSLLATGASRWFTGSPGLAKDYDESIRKSDIRYTS